MRQRRVDYICRDLCGGLLLSNRTVLQHKGFECEFRRSASCRGSGYGIIGEFASLLLTPIGVVSGSFCFAKWHGVDPGVERLRNALLICIAKEVSQFVGRTSIRFYALLDEQRNHLEPCGLLAQRLVVRCRGETAGSVEHLRQEVNVAHS